jgi:hypothetical protein
MDKSPEKKGIPDPLERRPKRQPSDQTWRALGRTAIKGSKKS